MKSAKPTIYLCCGLLSVTLLGWNLSGRASEGSDSAAEGSATKETNNLVDSATDWPIERGNAAGTGTATVSIPAKPEMNWKVELGPLEATAVIVDNVIYVGDADNHFYAVQLADGEVLWKAEFDVGFLSAAGVYEGRVYVGDYDANFHCLDAKSGEKIWSRQGPGEYFAGPNFFEGNVLVTSEAGTLTSYDAITGEPQWEFTIDAPLQCMPTISKGRIVLAGCDAQLHVIDAQTGDEVGAHEISGQTGSSPAALGARVFFGTEGGIFHALDTSPLKDAWIFRDPRRGQPIRTAAAVKQGFVIYGSHGKQVYALDSDSGDLRWQVATRSRLESSPIIAGDHVFVATTKGRLMSLSLNNGEKLWEFDAGGGFVASPAAANGRLIIGNTDGTLYCFGSK